MLQKAGIDPHGPHEVEVMRMIKREKKAAERASVRKSNSLQEIT
jgi:hypothetical protein